MRRPQIVTVSPRAVRPTVQSTTPQVTVGVEPRRTYPHVLRGLVRFVFFVAVVLGFMLAVSQPVTAIPLAAALIVAAVAVHRRG